MYMSKMWSRRGTFKRTTLFKQDLPGMWKPINWKMGIGGEKMKIAVTSTDQNLDSETSSVFGRCSYFVIVRIEEGKITNFNAVENQAKNQRGGAGMSAAQTVGNEGAEAVITGAIGPNAFSVLQELGIDVYKSKGKKVRGNIKLFVDGELEKINSATGGSGIGKRGRGKGPGKGRGR